MTEAKDLKRRVRARMLATAEPYVLARRRVLADSDGLVPPDLAHRIRSARRQRGWTAEEAARQLGTSGLKVGLLERAQAGVDLDLAEALVRVYELEPHARRRLVHLAEARRQAAQDHAPRRGVLSPWADRPELWIATRGRRSGVWYPKWWVSFVIDGDVAYLFEMEAERADWVANIRAHPEVFVWVDGEMPVRAVASEVTSDPAWRRSRQLLGAKHPDHRDLIEWAVPVALSVSGGSSR